MRQSLLMIGCGNMGGAMLDRWLLTGNYDITVVKPSPDRLPDSVRYITDPAALMDEAFDMVLVAVKPQMIDTALPPVVAALKTIGCLVSIAAGYSTDRLSAHARTGQATVRTMPNLPSSIGMGMTGMTANADTDDQQRRMTEALMACIGQILWVADEDAIDKVTAVAGSGPGFIFQLMESHIRAAEALGFSADEARHLVLQTYSGTVALAQASDRDVADLRRSVTSKGGTTAAGLDMLNGGGASDRLLTDTLLAAYRRAIDLR